MAWDESHKAQSRNKILANAADLFTAEGYDGVSIDQVMKHAGLTRGAFYAHFKSKTDLYAHAILLGANVARETMKVANAGSVEHLAEHYLKIGTQEGSVNYCPLAFLVTDICHREPEVKKAYTKVLQGFQAIIAGYGLNQREAIQTSIMMVGGLALSRATESESLRTDILAASLEGVKAIAAQLASSSENI